MASQDALVRNVNDATTLGNTISLRMVDFLNQVKDQPAGFRDLGLDFLSICHILNSLQGSLNEHVKIDKPFPQKAIPELMKVLTKTMDDFAHLQNLLHKFMEFEKGGTFAMLQKTWRLVFADKDIAKIRGSLQANKGALTMTMLLTDISPGPNTALPGYEYGILAAKLDHGSVAANLPPALPVRPPRVHEDIHYGQGAGSASMSPTSASEEILTPSISEMSISDRNLDPSTNTTTELYEGTVSPDGGDAKLVALPANDPQDKDSLPNEKEGVISPDGGDTRPADIDPPPRQRLPVTRVDRSKLQKRMPANPSSANLTALKKTLITAVLACKASIVEQLLDRGISPDTGPETNVVIEAVHRRDMPTLQLLLSFGADPDLPKSDGNTPLRLACECNYQDEARLLLEHGADANVSAPEWTPLPWALNHNSEGLARLLLQYGADPGFVMQNGWTSLVYAAEKNRLPEIVQALFDYGADANAKDGDGRTALGMACFRNHPDVVKVLLANGADPDVPGKELPILVSLRHPACLELLISAGADIHTYKGLMELATYYNSIDSVKHLLDAGVDPNEKHLERYSPITTAIRENRPEILALLLSRGADPNLQGEGFPLKMAVNKPEILKILLAAGADPKRYQGLIELAVWYNCLESIQILLEAGVSVDEKHLDKYSPLTTALRDKRVECLEYLLAHGADVNMEGEGVPLFWVVRVDDQVTLKMLLDAGASANKVWHGRTALMEACEWGFVGNVKLLLERGADVEAVDVQGRGPMDIAAAKGHDEVVMLLLEGMA